MKGIDNQPGRARPAQGTGASRATEDPWKPEAGEEVRRLRSVVTTREDQRSISNEMAPMMSEFLARLDGLEEPPPLLHEPPAFGDGPMGPAEVADTARSVVDAIEQSEFGSRMRDDGPVAQMLDEVKSFLKLRRVCISRCSNSAQ